MTDGDEPGKRCAHCRESFAADPDLAAVLEHYLDAHPDTDALRDVLDDVAVCVECEQCGEQFVSGLSHGIGGVLSADAYCADCAAAERVGELVVQELTAEEVVAQEVEP